MNYFNVSLVKFFIGSTNAFSHSYCNLFLTVLRIIFTSGTENYFFIGAENYFSRHRELIFWPTIHCGLAIEGDWEGV